MKFTKMQGAGNDFIVINNIEEKLPAERFGSLAAKLCTRRMSIGADGLMVVEKADAGGDYKMLFFNADGSMGEMCGNGARCIARYGYEIGLGGEELSVETTAGMVKGWRLDRTLYKVRLNDVTKMELHLSLNVLGKTFDCAYVELGSPSIPHLVLEYQGLREASPKELWELGHALRYHQVLPKGANVNFYEITGDDQIFERTFERGVEDFTYACGTGTASMVAVLTTKGLCSGKNVEVDMAGGKLYIDISRDGDTITDVFLTGPTMVVAQGEVNDEIWT